MGLFEKKLKRDKIAQKLCNGKRGDNDAVEFIDIVDKFFSSSIFESDNDFVIGARKSSIYNEVLEVLEKKKKVEDPLYFAVGSAQEFICNQNDVDRKSNNFVELRDKNDRYSNKGYICLEEKNYIEDMVNAIKMEKDIVLNNDQLLQYLDNPIATCERKTKAIDQYLKTDKEGKYLHLKFEDHDGKKYDFIGKDKMQFKLDEIIALKKYTSYLYEKAQKLYDK